MCNYCVQCGKETMFITIQYVLGVCVEPDCPNYGLLQVSNECLDSLEEVE